MPKRNEFRDSNRYCTPMFTTVASTIAQDGNNPNAHQMNGKQNVACHTMEYYSALKGIVTHATIHINLEVILLHEVSQTQKDKSCMIPLTRRIHGSQIHRLVTAGGRRKAALVLNGCGFQFETMEKFWS
jgi:hypothetical protein